MNMHPVDRLTQLQPRVTIKNDFIEGHVTVFADNEQTTAICDDQLLDELLTLIYKLFFSRYFDKSEGCGVHLSVIDYKGIIEFVIDGS